MTATVCDCWGKRCIGRTCGCGIARGGDGGAIGAGGTRC